MPCNAKNTPTMQTVLKTPTKPARESQPVFSNLSADFWQNVDDDGLMRIHSISPLRHCQNSNSDQSTPSPKKRLKRRRLINGIDEPVQSGDGNQTEKSVSKDVIVADNSLSIKRRGRHRRKSGLIQKGTPSLVSSQEGTAEIVEIIEGDSFASVKSIRNSKQTDQEQVFESSTLDPLKVPDNPLVKGQKRVMTELAPTNAKRLKKKSHRKKGLESSGHSTVSHSRKTKGRSKSGKTAAPVDSSTSVGVLSTEHLAEPQRTSTDLNRFETPKSSWLHRVSTPKVQTKKCKQNIPASGTSLEEAEIMVQSKNQPGVEGVGALYQQQTPQIFSTADSSLSITLSDLLEELSTSKRSRLSARLAKAKIACHEQKRRRRISLKRKYRESIGELDVTPGKMSPKEDLHTVKSQDIKLSAPLSNPNETSVEKHCQTQSKVPYVQTEQEVAINKAPVENGSDFETPKQQGAEAGPTCVLCSCSECKCPPSLEIPSTASEGIQTLGNVSIGVQVSPVVLKPDKLESEHIRASTHSSLHSQSCQTDFHETQTQTVHETPSFASQIPPDGCSTMTTPSDQKVEPVTVIKNFMDSLLDVCSDSKNFSKPSQLPGKETDVLKRFFESLKHVQATRSKSPPKPTPLLRRQSHRRRIESSESSDSLGQMDSEEAATLKSQCLSTVTQLVKPSTSKPFQSPRKETEYSDTLKSFIESIMNVSTQSRSPQKPTPLLRRQSHRRRIKSAGSSDSTKQTDSWSKSSSEELAIPKSHCLSPVLQLMKPPPAPGEILPKVIPLNFMKFSRHCGRRPIGKRVPQELFSSSGDSDSDVGRARAAAQRFINMTDDSDSDEGLGDRKIDDGEMLVGTQQINRKQYRRILDGGSEGADYVDHKEGQGVVEDGSGSDCSIEHIEVEEYIDNYENSAQEVNISVSLGHDGLGDRESDEENQDLFADGSGSDCSLELLEVEEFIDNDESSAEEGSISDKGDNDHTIVGTSASECDEDDVLSSIDTREEWSEELDDGDYGNPFILDQATESRLKDDPESDCYSDANEFDITDDSQSENLIPEDVIRGRQHRNTPDNKVYGRRMSPRKNRRRILDELFSSSEEISLIGSPKESHGMPGHLKVSIGERVNDISSSGNGSDSDTDQNSSGSQESVLQKQVSSNIVLDDDESKSEQVKSKKRLNTTGLLADKGKMLKIFKQQAEKKMIAKEKQAESKAFKETGFETSHHEIDSKDKQQEPSGQAVESTARDEKDHRDGSDHDDEVFRLDVSDERQVERKECTDEDKLDNDENLDGHVKENREEGDILKDETEDIGGSDSDDTSLTIPDYGSSDDSPADLNDRLLKKSKSQIKKEKQSEMKGSLQVKQKMLKTRKQRSDGKRTKSTKVKKDCGKTNLQSSNEYRKEKGSNKRGGLNRRSRAAKSEDGDANSDQNNLVQDDNLGDDEDVDGQTNIDRTEQDGIKDIEEDIGGSDSDDTIVNSTDDENRGVSGECSIIQKTTTATQSKEVTEAGLRRGRKSAKGPKTKKSLSRTESLEYDPDNSGLLVKRKAKNLQKLTGLLSEAETVKNRGVSTGEKTKSRNTKEDGKNDHQQSTSGEQHGESRSLGEQSLNGCDEGLGDDENENRDDAIMTSSNEGSHDDKSQTSSLKQSGKVTQLTTDKQTKDGLLKKGKPPQRKNLQKLTGLLSEAETVKNRGVSTREKTKSRNTKEDGKNDHQQSTSGEQHGESRSLGEQSLNGCDEGLGDDENENRDDAIMTSSNEGSHDDKSQTSSLKQSGKVTQLTTDKQTKDGLLKKGKPPQRKNLQKLTGLLSEAETVKNRGVSTREKTKSRNTKEDGKNDHQQSTSGEQHGESRSLGEQSLNGCDEGLGDDENENGDDAIMTSSDEGSHDDKSQTSSLKQSGKVTQLTTDKQTKDGLLKKGKPPQRKNLQKLTGLLSEAETVKNKGVSTREKTKSRNTKEDGKNDHQQSTSGEQHGESRSLGEQSLNGCDEGLGDDENENGDDAIMTSSDEGSHDDKSQTSSLKQSGKVTQLTTDKQTKDGLLKKGKPPQRKNLQKLTGLLSEAETVKNRGVSTREKTKSRNTKEDGKNDHQQSTSGEQHGESRSLGEQSLNGCDEGLGDDENENGDDAIMTSSDEGSHDDKSQTSSLKQSGKVTQLTTDKQTKDGLLKKGKPPQRKNLQKLTGLLSEAETVKNRGVSTREKTKSRNTKEDGKNDHQQSTSGEQHGESRSLGEQSLNGCDEGLGDDENENRDDAIMTSSNEGSHDDKSQTSSLKQSGKVTQLTTDKQTKDGLLKKGKPPQRKNLQKLTGLLSEAETVKNRGVSTREKTKSRNTKEDGKNDHQQSTSGEQHGESRSLGEQSLNGCDEGLGDDENENGDDAIMTSSDEGSHDDKSQTSSLKQSRKVTQLTTDKQTKDGLLKKGKPPQRKNLQKLTGLLSEADTVKNRGVSTREKTKPRNTKEDGKNNHQQSTSGEQHGESRSLSEQSLNGCDEGLGDDENENGDDAIMTSDEGSHDDKSQTSSLKQSGKVTLLTTDKQTKDGHLKKGKPPQRKNIKKSLDRTDREQDYPRNYDGFLYKTKLMNSTVSSGKSSSKSAKDSDDGDCYFDSVDLVLSVKDQDEEESDSYDDCSNDVESLGGKLMDDEDKDRSDREQDYPRNYDGLLYKSKSHKKLTQKTLPEMADMGKSKIKSVLTESMEKNLSLDNCNERVDNGKLIESPRQSKKKTLTKTNAQEGERKERNSPKSKQVKNSCDLRKRKEGEPDKSRPLKKLKNKTLLEKTETQTESKKVKTKLARKTKQVDVQNSPIEKTSEDNCGESRIDNTGEDAVGTDHQGDLGIIGKASSLKKSTKSKTAKQEKALKGEIKNAPKKSDFRRSLKTMEATEVVAELMNDRKSTKKNKQLSSGGKSEDKEQGGTSSLAQSTKFTKLKTKEDTKGGQPKEKKTLKLTKSKKNLAWTNLINSTVSSGKSSSKSAKDSVDSDCYFDAVDLVLSVKDQDEEESDSYDDCSNDVESLGAKLMDDEDKDREGNSTGNGDKNLREADDMRDGSHCDDVGHGGQIVTETRLRNPPIHGLLKEKGKLLGVFKQEVARKMMENVPATDAKPDAWKASCNFGEIRDKNYDPIMYTIKSDTNRAICEGLITPMPLEWEEPLISSKDREDHQSALRSIFYDTLLKRGRKNRIAARRRSGNVKLNRRPTIKELKKANTAEKRRLKKLEAEVKSDGWIEYDMLPAVYPETDETVFIKAIK
ncbi:uncharacterized protein [Asterias amurensis]|uniref:uncharacterized protein n=1 Tax=Asterias amurensis TaxID=7602 RepID=UPI003AB6A3D4